MFSGADLGMLKGIYLSNSTNLKYQNRTVYANYSNETLGGKVMTSTQSMQYAPGHTVGNTKCSFTK